MIGKVIVGKSLRKCLDYCLDKKQAEILDHNLCCGNKKEILEQMNDVRNQNQNVTKPVQHITLSMSPGERLSKGDLIKLAEECAREMGFDKNQYVVVQHHDTRHQHIHIIINRIGLDGKTLSDSHNYKKIAEFCRKMEIKFKLKKVLSPRRYQSKEQRRLPRMDGRKEQLKKDIKKCLAKATNYSRFEQLIKQRGYTVEKARGIAFIDSKKVRIKGSEVGYSLSTIEKILQQNLGKQNIMYPKTFAGQVLQQNQSAHLSGKTSNDLHITNPASKNIADILTEKPVFEESINHSLKKNRRQKL